jgi:hypothetical protein
VPKIDVIQEAFIAARPTRIAAHLRRVDVARELWPDLSARLVADRGDEGMRWVVAGALCGSAEVWLEAFGRGTIVHTYLRVDAPGRSGPARERDRRARHATRFWWALKDDLESAYEHPVGDDHEVAGGNAAVFGPDGSSSAPRAPTREQ